MEKDIERIKEKLEEFMKEYNVTVEIETYCQGRSYDGTIIAPKARITIHS